MRKLVGRATDRGSCTFNRALIITTAHDFCTPKQVVFLNIMPQCNINGTEKCLDLNNEITQIRSES